MTRLTLIISVFILIACKATHPTTTFEKVKSGQDLDKISLVSFDNFFSHWVHNRRIQKIDLNIHELYRDSSFTYFGKYNLGFFRSTQTFFKVYTDTLARQFPNYSDFYGDELERFLWKEVVPKEDKNLFNDNTTIKQGQAKSNCPVRKNRNKYSYLLEDKKVILTMTWDIECSQLEKLKNKKYQASYNLTTKQFEK